MSYRIARITGLYREYINQYQATFSQIIKSGSFQGQYDHLIQDSCDTASSISKHFRKRGTDALDIFTNAEWLQNSWKAAHDSSYSGMDLVLEQLKSFRPEVVWIDDPSYMEQNWVANLRQNVPSVKIVTGLVCAPYNSSQLRALREFNFVTTCTPCLNKEFQKLGMKSFLIYHGFDEDILDKIGYQNKYPSTDLLFTGSLYTGGGYHNTRIEYLEKFLEESIPVKIYGMADSTKKILSKMIAFYSINFFRKIGAEKLVPHVPLLKQYESYGQTPVRFYTPKLKASLFQPVYGLEQFKLLSKAKICFNIHLEMAKKCAGNLRLFEATGVGTCLVTDWKDNLGELFEPDKEVICYRSQEECIDKIKWLMNNPSEAEKIGKAGKARVLKDHTIKKRTELIHEIITKNM